MQAGIPIVATNVGEVPEVLNGGLLGRLVQPGNPEDLANALEEVRRNQSEAKKKAFAAKQRALTEYCLGKMAQRYLEEYRNVLSTNRK